MINNLARRVLGAAVGLVLVLGYWTLKDKVLGDSSHTVSDRVPAKVWEGGTNLTIESESSEPATLRVFFESTAKTGGKPLRSLETYEKIPAGTHSWTIDVPAAVGGSVELEAENPKPGARLSWTVRSGESVLKHEAETLEGALRANEVFCLTLDAEDFSRAEAEQ